VHEGEGKITTQIGHLALNSVVREVARTENRLKYDGVPRRYKGPASGWVSINAGGPWGKDYLKPWNEGDPVPTAGAVTAREEKALILFDWDDTLLPTTYIQSMDDSTGAGSVGAARVPVAGEAGEALREQAAAVQELLNVASLLGTVAVVTLSQRPWVSDSVQAFMPECQESVSALDVFYASEQRAQRGRAEDDDFGGVSSTLKQRTMEQAMKAVSERIGGGAPCKWQSFVSIGDGEAEERAAQDFGRQCQVDGQLKWTKTVKLHAKPTAAELTSQVIKLTSHLRELVEHQGSRHVDIAMWMDA